jgi:hypothetical protein
MLSPLTRTTDAVGFAGKSAAAAGVIVAAQNKAAVNNAVIFRFMSNFPFVYHFAEDKTGAVLFCLVSYFNIICKIGQGKPSLSNAERFTAQNPIFS